MVPEDAVQSKVNSSIALVKSIFIDPDVLLNLEFPVSVILSPDKPPEEFLRFSLPFTFSKAIFPEEDIDLISPFMSINRCPPELLSTTNSPIIPIASILPEEVSRCVLAVISFARTEPELQPVSGLSKADSFALVVPSVQYFSYLDYLPLKFL